MAEETLYTIGQLAELAGVTPRTIRYYTAEGLLPRPDARGQYALYGEEHLLRLQLIAQLKETYLPLGEIKARIENLDAEQIRALLDEHRESLAPPASAADYLAQVRARQQAPQSARHLAERAESYAAAETPMLSLRPPAAPAPAAPAPAAPAYGFAAPIAAPAAAGHDRGRGSCGSTAAAGWPAAQAHAAAPRRCRRTPTRQGRNRRRQSSAGGASILRPASSCTFASRPRRPCTSGSIG